MECPVCHEDFKNLGVHMRAHKTTENYMANVIVDTPTDKRLSELIDAMKELVKPYKSRISVSYDEEDGYVKGIEFTARIQLRR